MDDIRQGKCPLCNHHEIIEAELQETDKEGYPSPLPVCWVMLPDRRRFDPVGALKAYVCRRCGRTELFAASPERIPVGKPTRTRLIEGPEVAGPYR